MDRSIKYFKYLSAGVREYWIVDPDIESVLVWNFENNTAATYTFQQMIPVGIYGDLKIEFSKMDIYN